VANQAREEERRDATIRAVWASIARSGTVGTTIEAVAEIAGFSKGVIHYWFASKKDLLLAALEAFLVTYDKEIEERLAGLGREASWADALDAIVEAILPPFSPEDVVAAPLPLLAAGEGLSPRYKARLFLQFFALAITDPDFGAVVATNYERQGEGIARCLEALEPAAPPRAIQEQTATFMALVDGFSLHRVLGYVPKGLAPHGELARSWLKSAIAGKGSEPVPGGATERSDS
jgi:TetR/AcrR family transcriptional repressor of bet genes